MKLSRKLIIITLVFSVNNLVIGQAFAETAYGFGVYVPETIQPITESPTVVEQPEQKVFSTQDLIDSAAMNLSGIDFSQTQSFGFFNNQLNLEMPINFSADTGELNVKKFGKASELPWNLDRISQIYEIDFSPSASLDAKQPINLTLSYDNTNNYFKQVYFYDQAGGGWKAMPTTDFPKERVVKAVLTQTNLIIGVFAKPGVLTVGKASWYKYKGGLFAASPDFPKGSVVRVTNLDNNKSVDVVINDWGPERDKHPDRVVDLDKEAFKAIAETSAGVINVMVSPIKLATDSNGRVLGVKAETVASQPKLSARSVIIINEANGEVVFDKNSNANLPLASLTKIVAVKVFLETNPDLEKLVAYKLQDEEYNYRYCKSWESAKVRLSEGEKLKIKDLVYSALVGSANNAVETLVRVSGLTRFDFIKQMNEQAKAWGATRTKFVEPTGLSSSNVSSAMDYALMMKAALTDNLISKISSTASYTFKTASNKSHTIKNTNKLIVEQAQANLKAEKYPISASKTGYLAEAGYCLATRVKAKDANYIIVSLGATTREKSFNEMADLIKYLGRTI